jgi:hypothetical protein
MQLPEVEKEKGKATALDLEIIACARKNLHGRGLQAFFFAYHCTPEWEDVQMLFSDRLGVELKKETVVRYATEAATRIVETI